MATERDPVCGMMVETETAKGSMVEGGRTYYFCSETCRSRFAANPAGFTAAGMPRPAPHMERHEPPHTTTGRFTAPKFGSAGSGGLEFEPLPEAHDRDDESPRKATATRKGAPDRGALSHSGREDHTAS